MFQTAVVPILRGHDMRRDLPTTLGMLQHGGLEASARIANGLIEVHLGEHQAVFLAADGELAADWLAECAVMKYPDCELSKVWMMLVQVAGGAIPFASR